MGVETVLIFTLVVAIFLVVVVVYFVNKYEKRGLTKATTETDQTRLAEIVKKSKTNPIRMTALKRITDKSILMDLAENSNNDAVRNTAQTLLATAVEKEKEEERKELELNQRKIEAEALRQKLSEIAAITDQSILVQIAKTDMDDSVKKAAARRVIDKSCFTPQEKCKLLDEHTYGSTGTLKYHSYYGVYMQEYKCLYCDRTAFESETGARPYNR